MKQIATKAAALACTGALALAVLGGCAQQQTSAVSEEQEANRTYMMQVNQTMDDLQDKLGSFTDAVSRGDVVTMRTQADSAFKAIDDLSALEAPDALADIKASYVEGATELKEALSAYVDLYTEIESATDEAPFDWTTYAQRIADIQERYNAGIEKLQAGDDKAVELNQS